MSGTTTRRAERGFLMPLVLLLLAAFSALVMASADWRVGRMLAAERAYQEAAALALARGGVESAVAYVRHGRAPPERPLSDPVRLGDATGHLTVRAFRLTDGVKVHACGWVDGRSGPVRRCIHTVLEADRSARVREWRED